MTILSDVALDQIRSFQISYDNNKLYDLISCLEETLKRINWVNQMFHLSKDAKDIYYSVDTCVFGSFVTTTYHTIYRINLIYKSSIITFSFNELNDLIKNIKQLVKK